MVEGQEGGGDLSLKSHTRLRVCKRNCLRLLTILQGLVKFGTQRLYGLALLARIFSGGFTPIPIHNDLHNILRRCRNVPGCNRHSFDSHSMFSILLDNRATCDMENTRLSERIYHSAVFTFLRRKILC